jgi:hypothetical protein
MKASLLLIALATGCMAKTGTLGQADSQSIGDSLGSGLEDSAKTFGPMNTQNANASCVTLSGDVGDPDLDNIPNNATLTFNCTTTALGVTEVVTGTMNVVDDQPNAIAWAFHGSQALNASITGSGGGSVVVATNGDLTATQTGLAGPFGLARSATVTSTITGPRGNSVVIDETADWNITFTPQATWTPGQIIVTGMLDAQGSWDVTVGSNSASAMITTSTPLTLDPACATRVTGGAVDANWSGGGKTHALTVTWTGCGARTVTYTER